MRLAVSLVFLASSLSAANLLNSVPLRFEPSANAHFPWVARNGAFATGFGADSVVLRAGDRALRLTFPGSNPRAEFEGLEPSFRETHYYRGHDHRAARGYAKLKRSRIYPSIDVIYYGTGQNLEYDFELAPGADPALIRMRFEGADRVQLNAQGEISLGLGGGEIVQRLPVVYQRRASGEIVSVPSSYRIAENGDIGLRLDSYDPSRTLVVDPNITVAAYMSGTGGDGVIGMSRDAKGLLYMVGFTYSTDFPLVGDSYSPFLHNSFRDCWVMRLDPKASGNDLIQYSSFFGGAATEDPKAMTVDSAGVVYFTGTTDSFDYPTTDGAYNKTFAGGTKRIFVTAFDTAPGGQDGLVYSTIFGGTKNDEPTGIAAARGKIYLTGFTTSDDYPIANQTQTGAGSYDAFVAVFDPSKGGTDSLIFSTYLGGTGQDVGRSIAVDAAGKVWVGGFSFSGDFPTTAGSFQPYYSGGGDAFLTRLNVDASTVEYSTYLGGRDHDQIKKILALPNGRVALTGYTQSVDYPVTQNAYQPVLGGSADVFLTILDPAARDSAALVYSTYFGGRDAEVAYDMRSNGAGRYYLVGYTMSRDLPVRGALNSVSASTGGSDGFVAVLDTTALPSAALVYSSYVTSDGAQVVYGVESDGSSIMIAGNSTSGVFGPGLAQPVIPSNTNVFLLIFQP